MLWQPVFTWDVVAAMVAALDRPETAGRAYTIAGPKAITYRQMLETIIREAKLRTRLVPVPLSPIGPLVRTYEKISKAPRVRYDQVLRLQENKDFDISEARRDLGFAPISFEEGIRRKLDGTA
jgi:nucleoside-diphosphate-sugar epimerase